MSLLEEKTIIKNYVELRRYVKNIDSGQLYAKIACPGMDGETVILATGRYLFEIEEQGLVVLPEYKSGGFCRRAIIRGLLAHSDLPCKLREELSSLLSGQHAIL